MCGLFLFSVLFLRVHVRDAFVHQTGRGPADEL